MSNGCNAWMVPVRKFLVLLLLSVVAPRTFVLTVLKILFFFSFFFPGWVRGKCFSNETLIINFNWNCEV